MTEHEHSINRAETNSAAEDTDDSDDDEEDEQRSEAEIKRELRESVVGRAILDIARQRGRR